MPEISSNVEFANRFLEESEKQPMKNGPKERYVTMLEILEALLLAVAAVATAWSGYQAAIWDGRSQENTARVLAYNIEEDEAMGLAGQALMHDIMTFNTWLEAKARGENDTVALLERRFSGSYKTAFDAWMKLDPLNNPDAPPGPSFLPEYVNELTVKAAELRQRGKELREDAESSREIAKDYVRLTVLLALALFLTAISQRFTYKRARFGLLGLACIVTIGTLILIGVYPRM